jgi:3-deoxy-D-manno-octulosonate 8-phosphate phosphatase (KDO 8-P phosphatase)
MSIITELESRFSKLGGVFLTPALVLAERVTRMHGFVCDWDGVFNDGAKSDVAQSTYNEPDSMGTNLLRYALWRVRGRSLPICALVTGAANPSAHAFAMREHFQAVYYGARNKTAAIESLCGTHGLSTEQLLCIFDDVNDLGMRCGIRVLVRRDASPLLHDYITRRHLCDYVTANTPQRHAVREVCELLLGLLGSFDAVVASRVAWDDDYQRYFAERQAVVTDFVDQEPKG